MKVLSIILGTLLISMAAYAGGTPVTMTFATPKALKPAQVWVTFVNTNGIISGTYKNPKGHEKTLVLNKSYSLAELTSPTALNGAPANTPAVSITNYDSGRVYLSIGKKLTGLKQGQQPVANLTSDPNYKKRYQYFEPTVKKDGNGHTCLWVDLSYIDFTSISLSLEIFNATTAANSPQKTTACGTALVKAANESAAPGKNNVRPRRSKRLPDPKFARVVAPNIDGEYYHDWSYMLQKVLPGVAAHIKGLFAGTGPGPWEDVRLQQQTYDFNATFDTSGGVTFTANADSGNGHAACIPTKLQGNGIGNNVSIRIDYDDLNSITGIWGNNPGYTVTRNNVPQAKSAGLTNDVYGWIVGDLMAGLCYGFVGSSTKCNGRTIGGMDSADWWGGLRIDGTKADPNDTPAGKDIVFGKAQSDKLCYHNYAAALLPLTPGYGFPLQDRLGRNLMTYDAAIDKNAYVRVTINPDSIVNSSMVMPQQ